MGVRKRKKKIMEEEGRPPIPLLLPTTKRRSPTPNHPPYSEMVQVALRSLSEKEGSTIPSISSFILSTYSGLPWAHSRLLPYYLRKLLLAGDISMPYPSRFSANPNSASGPGNPPVGPPLPMPPRRGRGRPRKNPVEMPCSTRPKLILRLKRRKLGGGGWLWLLPPPSLPDTESGNRTGPTNHGWV